VSAHTSSPETSPSIETSESKKTSGGLQENVNRHSSPEEGLKVFFSDENPVSGSDATPPCETAETKALSKSNLKGNKQSSDGEESDISLPTGLTNFGDVTNEAFQLDETGQTKHDVQVGLITLRTLYDNGGPFIKKHIAHSGRNYLKSTAETYLLYINIFITYV
jgi:hypothetical protein